MKAAVLQQKHGGGGDGQEEAADPAAASAAASPMPPVQLVAIRHIPRHVKSSLATSILIPSNGSASLSPHSERFHHPSPPHGSHSPTSPTSHHSHPPFAANAERRNNNSITSKRRNSQTELITTAILSVYRDSPLLGANYRTAAYLDHIESSPAKNASSGGMKASASAPLLPPLRSRGASSRSPSPTSPKWTRGSGASTRLSPPSPQALPSPKRPVKMPSLYSKPSPQTSPREGAALTRHLKRVARREEDRYPVFSLEPAFRSKYGHIEALGNGDVALRVDARSL